MAASLPEAATPASSLAERLRSIAAEAKLSETAATIHGAASILLRLVKNGACFRFASAPRLSVCRGSQSQHSLTAIVGSLSLVQRGGRTQSFDE